MTAVCWFRTDLRVTDQPALAAAAALGPTIGLFIASPEQWRLHRDAPIKIDFWLRAIKHLRAELEALNIPLKILVVDHWKDVPAALLSFCQRHNVEQVHCNREHGVNERNRDRASYSLLAQHNIALQGHHGGTLLIPGSVKTGADAYYRVFTPFAKACREKLRSAPYRLTPSLKKQSAADLPASDDLPKVLTALLSAIPEGLQRAWPATPTAALERLEQFAQTRMARYQPDRDFPAIPGTSVLSPYLAAGLISAGQCLHAALVQNQGESDTGQRGIVVWINELLWREFYQHLLFGYPALSMHQPMRAETNAVVWRQAPEDFDAWAQGRTGVPIVDAAMRQLLATGWMHNRLRMVVAMYLTKNLLIDWRLGEAFFMQHLIDGELAANNGGWQWSASTGADSAPYFRVFNPISQSEKFDPEGAFIKHWLPELSTLNAKEIHNPSPISRKALNYPDQIVNLQSSRVRAIEAFKNLK
jgi:deoxyribodipyrimidine photo-lyase